MQVGKGAKSHQPTRGRRERRGERVLMHSERQTPEGQEARAHCKGTECVWVFGTNKLADMAAR